MGWVTLALRKKELKSQHAFYQMRALEITREKRQLARREGIKNTQIENEQSIMLSNMRASRNEERKNIQQQIKALEEFRTILNSVSSGVLNNAKVGENEIYTQNKDGNYLFDENGNQLFVYDYDTTYADKSEAHVTTLTKPEGDVDNLTTRPATTADIANQISGYDELGKTTTYDQYEIPSSIQGINIDPTKLQDEKYVDSLKDNINDQIDDLRLDMDDIKLQYSEQEDFIKTNYEDELQELEDQVQDQELELDMEQVEIETQMEAISNELQAVADGLSSQIQQSTIKLA